MKNRFDLIVFLPVEWLDSNPLVRHSVHFLFPALARFLSERGGKILCLERPVTLSTPFLNKKKFWKWIIGGRGMRRVNRNLFVWTPFALLDGSLIEKFPIVKYLDKIPQSLMLRKILKTADLNSCKLIYVICHPYQTHYLNLLGGSPAIYYCYDEHSASLPEQGAIILEKREKDLLQKVDIVFSVSDSITEKKKIWNKNVFTIRNAVDYELFSQSTMKKTRVPEDIAGIKKPIIGYIGGLLGEMVDYELLLYLAFRHPEWSFVLIGECEWKLDNADGKLRKEARKRGEHKKIINLANVHFFGRRDYELLPGYLKAFSVCVLPFKVNPLMCNTSPLKLYEYLATGKPIVSTDIPEAHRFGKLVRVSEDYGKFESHLSEAINENNNILTNLRLNIARENSWDERAKEIFSIIEDTFLKKEEN